VLYSPRGGGFFLKFVLVVRIRTELSRSFLSSVCAGSTGLPCGCEDQRSTWFSL
jgi:hypothetical protein